MTNFFTMGNYGIYVWTAYFITIAVFGIILLLSYREKIAVKKTIQQFLATHSGDYAATLLKPAILSTTVTHSHES
jgi:heme exporter protein CcmD